jgi:hypothetical protein
MDSSVNQAKRIAIEMLRQQDNDRGNPFVAASIAYEIISGDTLHHETDPTNGEDYLFKADPCSTVVSTRLHPEVVEFFGFSSSDFSFTNDNIDTCIGSMYFEGETGSDMADHLESHWGQYVGETRYVLTPNELAKLVFNLLTSMDSGALDENDQYTAFINDIAQVVTEHCGGEVVNVTEKGDVHIQANDSLPSLDHNVYVSA